MQGSEPPPPPSQENGKPANTRSGRIGAVSAPANARGWAGRKGGGADESEGAGRPQLMACRGLPSR